MFIKRVGTFIAAASVAGAMVAPASADVPVTINAGVGQWYFDKDRDLDDVATPFVSLEYAFDDNWAAELYYAEDESSLEGSGADVDVSTWQIDMLYYGGSYIGEGNRVRPYLAFGAGEIEFDGGDSFDTTETTVNVGAGMRWMLTPRFGARFEAKVFHSLDEHENDLMLSAGLNYYFGKVKADPVVAAAPVDSDGDGVIDANDQCPGTAAGVRVDANGCPLPVAQVASIKMKVNFGFDSSRVQEKYFTDISELAKFLNRFKDVDVDIEGHTDSVGPDTYNQSLSQKRAQAVVDVLVNQHGIDRSRLEAKGYGESRPTATNDTDEGRAANRRVMATLEVEYKD